MQVIKHRYKSGFELGEPFNHAVRRQSSQWRQVHMPEYNWAVNQNYHAGTKYTGIKLRLLDYAAMWK